MTSLNVGAIIRGGLTRFTDQLGRLWCALADYYIRSGHFEKVFYSSLHPATCSSNPKTFKTVFVLTLSCVSYVKARDVYEEAIQTVVTVRDFTQVFDSYAQFEESMIAAKMETTSEMGQDQDGKRPIENVSCCRDEPHRCCDGCCNLPAVDDIDLELRLARFEQLITRRPLLLNSVLLRQNPHNVHEWHKRVNLYEGIPRQVSRGLFIYLFLSLGHE